MTANLERLEALGSELSSAIRELVQQCQATGSGPPVDARRRIIARAAKIQEQLVEPADFLQKLAVHSQLLACLGWLCEFQILACISLRTSVAIKDLADLAGVPAIQLAKVIRMMATAGFLLEPQAGFVAHSKLSALFVAKPACIDAATFLSQTAAPSALKMSMATKQPGETAFSLLNSGSAETFLSTCKQRPILQRQWRMYLRYVGGQEDRASTMTELLLMFDWASLGSSVVVDAAARSTKAAVTLAERHPAIRLIVQACEPSADSMSGQTGVANGAPSFSSNGSRLSIPANLSARISIQHRRPGELQVVDGAAVYICQVPWNPISGHGEGLPLSAHVAAELRAHVGVLRSNPAARLLVATCILPPPGTLEAVVESLERAQDLSVLQLGNEHRLDEVDFMSMLSGIIDERAGQLVLVNTLRSQTRAVVVFELRLRGSHEIWSQNGALNLQMM